MQRLPRRTVLASIIATAALATARPQHLRAKDSTPATGDASAAPAGAAVLPRDIILPMSAVQEVVPDITTETATGENATAVGNPTANRAVTFATADGAHRVVLSVDRYESADDASTAFQDAFRASQEVPGVTAEAVADLGEAALIGVVTQGDETHVGGGALFGDLIVNATLQAYEGTDANKAIVAELIQRQAEHAEQALRPGASPTPAG
jgi:hypothetical protein